MRIKVVDVYHGGVNTPCIVDAVPGDITVLALKQRITATHRLSPPLGHQKLLFGGSILRDDEVLSTRINCALEEVTMQLILPVNFVKSMQQSSVISEAGPPTSLSNERDQEEVKRQKSKKQQKAKREKRAKSKARSEARKKREAVDRRASRQSAAAVPHESPGAGHGSPAVAPELLNQYYQQQKLLHAMQAQIQATAMALHASSPAMGPSPLHAASVGLTTASTGLTAASAGLPAAVAVSQGIASSVTGTHTQHTASFATSNASPAINSFSPMTGAGVPSTPPGYSPFYPMHYMAPGTPNMNPGAAFGLPSPFMQGHHTPPVSGVSPYQQSAASLAGHLPPSLHLGQSSVAVPTPMFNQIMSQQLVQPSEHVRHRRNTRSARQTRPRQRRRKASVHSDTTTSTRSTLTSNSETDSNSEASTSSGYSSGSSSSASSHSSLASSTSRSRRRRRDPDPIPAPAAPAVPPPPPQPGIAARVMAAINPGMIIRLVILVGLFGWDADPQRLPIFVAVGVGLYLVLHVQLFQRITRVLCCMRHNQDPRSRRRPRSGFIPDLFAVSSLFVLSVLPWWEPPLPLPEEPTPAPVAAPATQAGEEEEHGPTTPENDEPEHVAGEENNDAERQERVAPAVGAA